jgi:hypothetical protein
VRVFELDGSFGYSFGRRGCKPGEFWNPGSSAISATHLFYVCDTRNCRVQVLRQDGSFVRLLPGTFRSSPVRLALANNKVYVAERWYVHAFDEMGAFQFAFETPDEVYTMAAWSDGLALLHRDQRVHFYDWEGMALHFTEPQLDCRDMVFLEHGRCLIGPRLLDPDGTEIEIAALPISSHSLSLAPDGRVVFLVSCPTDLKRG